MLGKVYIEGLNGITNSWVIVNIVGPIKDGDAVQSCAHYGCEGCVEMWKWDPNKESYEQAEARRIGVFRDE